MPIQTPDNLNEQRFRRCALRVFPYCQWCKVRLSFADSTADHIQPAALGGSDDWSNLCLACGPCNSSRAPNWHPGVAPTYGPSDWSKVLDIDPPDAPRASFSEQHCVVKDGKKSYIGWLYDCHEAEEKLKELFPESTIQVVPLREAP
jgi:hypothetical protein